jgi:hypothetical protein
LTAPRTAAVAAALCLMVLGGLEGRALADGPTPEPAPPPASPLHPDPAPGAQQAPKRSSGSTPTVQSSQPAVITPTTQAVAPPARATVQPAATLAHKAQSPARRTARTSGRSHTRSAAVNRFVRLPGLVLDRTSFRAIGGQVTVASTSRESRLLLIGGLALVLLVIGETTFLALARARLGLRER